jgi:hypothetical protein
MDDRHTTRRRLTIAAASVVVPLATVVLALQQGGLWLLAALAVGVTGSLVLVEVGERYAAPAKEDRR